MDKFGKEVALIFFILLGLSFVLGIYYMIYSGSAEPWKDLPVYKGLFGFSKALLLVMDLPIFIYVLAVPPFVSAKLPTLAVIVVVFFVLLNITYLYLLSTLITRIFYNRKRSS